MPSKKPTDGESPEYITVLNEMPPSNLPGTDYFLLFYIMIYFSLALIEINKGNKEENPNQDKKDEEDSKQNQKRLLEEMEKQRLSSQLLSCCHHGPHKTFPGIEHYLNIATSRNRSFSIDKRIMSSDENKKETNNDAV